MTWIIGIILGVIAVTVAALPFLRKRGVGAEGSDPVRGLQERRQAIYQEIQLLQADMTVGQVSEQEYHDRLQAHRMAAALLVREEQRLLDLQQGLEEEVLAVRGKTKQDVTACPNCSRAAPRGAIQCPACGAALVEAASRG